jgi:hypothetical protein
LAEVRIIGITATPIFWYPEALVREYLMGRLCSAGFVEVKLDSG